MNKDDLFKLKMLAFFEQEGGYIKAHKLFLANTIMDLKEEANQMKVLSFEKI